VLSSFRKRLTYSNVTATAALFIALGGTSYAVIRVDSRDVVDNSLRSTDLRNNSVRSRDVRDRTLHAGDLRRNASAVEWSKRVRWDEFHWPRMPTALGDHQLRASAFVVLPTRSLERPCA
jgi:hypothetical protein